jgi:hypothetical protein
MANLTFKQVTQTPPSSTTTKGSLLTAAEVDGNMASLNQDIQTRILRTGDTLQGVLNWNGIASITATSTTNIGTANSNVVLITGSAVINALGIAPAGSERTVLFSGSPSLTYNATSLVLPYATDIGVLPGDGGKFISLGAGNWQCISYARDLFLPGTSAQYFRGDKIWVDFATDVRSAVLTGISFVSGLAVAGTDTILSAIGKLQKQITTKQDTLVSGVNLKTVNGQTLLGTTDIQITSNVATTPSNGTRLSANTQYHINGSTTSGFTFYLPAASRGDFIEFVDVTGNWDTGAWYCGYDGTGGKIMGLAETMLVNRANANFKIVFTDATGGWRIV